jgi:hypothetical protein
MRAAQTAAVSVPRSALLVGAIHFEIWCRAFNKARREQSQGIQNEFD